MLGYFGSFYFPRSLQFQISVIDYSQVRRLWPACMKIIQVVIIYFWDGFEPTNREVATTNIGAFQKGLGSCGFKYLQVIQWSTKQQHVHESYQTLPHRSFLLLSIMDHPLILKFSGQGDGNDHRPSCGRGRPFRSWQTQQAHEMRRQQINWWM